MCSNLFAIVDSMNGFSSVGLIGKAVLAMGLFAFAKQAPKLLGEALGFEGGNLKLGLKGKLADGGFLQQQELLEVLQQLALEISHIVEIE